MCHNKPARSTTTQSDESDRCSSDDASDSNSNTINEFFENKEALFAQALPDVNEPAEDDRMPVFSKIFEIL